MQNLGLEEVGVQLAKNGAIVVHFDGLTWLGFEITLFPTALFYSPLLMNLWSLG